MRSIQNNAMNPQLYVSDTQALECRVRKFHCRFYCVYIIKHVLREQLQSSISYLQYYLFERTRTLWLLCIIGMSTAKYIQRRRGKKEAGSSEEDTEQKKGGKTISTSIAVSLVFRYYCRLLHIKFQSNFYYYLQITDYYIRLSECRRHFSIKQNMARYLTIKFVWSEALRNKIRQRDA